MGGHDDDYCATNIFKTNVVKNENIILLLPQLVLVVFQIIHSQMIS